MNYNSSDHTFLHRKNSTRFKHGKDTDNVMKDTDNVIKMY
jgi:hypothetical protein